MKQSTNTIKLETEFSSAWEECRAYWLKSFKSANTRRMYAAALDALLAYCGCTPDKVTKKDILAWFYHLQEKNKNATVESRMAAVASFYQYASETYTVRDQNGAEVYLAKVNPVGKKRKRLKVKPYQNVRVLTVSEVKKLLAQPNLFRVVGLRDYALMLGYLSTGRRNSEWRLARVSDFTVRDQDIFFKWSGKGHEDEKVEISQPLWDALSRYIAESGGRGPFDYIFLDQEGSRPLGDRRVLEIVKKYSRAAGLGDIRVHDLRHTAVMLMRVSGADVKEIQEFLNHTSLKATEFYMHKLERGFSSRIDSVASIITGRNVQKHAKNKRNLF